MKSNNGVAVIALVLIAVGLILEFTVGHVFAAGDYSFNYFASGDYACGVFAAGTFAVGVFSIGIFSIGIFSLGIFNIGLYAIGLFVFGWKKGLPKTIKEFLKARSNN